MEVFDKAALHFLKIDFFKENSSACHKLLLIRGLTFDFEKMGGAELSEEL